MYAAATYKARYETDNPHSKTLDAFIADDRAQFTSEHPGLSIAEVAPLKTADGQTLRSFTYFRPTDKVWERVSFGYEGDYYIVFTISSKSESAYRQAQPAYEDLISRYRK